MNRLARRAAVTLGLAAVTVVALAGPAAAHTEAEAAAGRRRAAPRSPSRPRRSAPTAVRRRRVCGCSSPRAPPTCSPRTRPDGPRR